MTEFTDKPGYSFNPGPPPEASAYLRNKGLKPSFSWQDVEPSEHANGFAVAKAMQVDVLQSIQGELQKALDEGVPFKEFQKTLKPRLQKLGWWGVKEETDPVTGERRKVQLGSPRRLKTIYRSNIRAARAAGQWDRIERTKEALPYLLYLLGPSEQHRPAHQAKAGLVLPVDDPFWRTWYPPNGWGCKCHVRQVTRREAERRGISDSPEVEMRDVHNPRTGEITRIPAGIDKGWETNPGLHRQRQMDAFLRGKLDAADPAIARIAAKDMASSWRMRRIHEGSAQGSAPVAMLPEDLARALGSNTRVVQFSDETASKVRRKHGEAGPEEFVRVAELVETGTVAKEIATTGTRSLIVQSRDQKPWRLVIKTTRDGDELFMTTFHRSTPAKWSSLLSGREVEIIRD